MRSRQLSKNFRGEDGNVRRKRRGAVCPGIVVPDDRSELVFTDFTKIDFPETSKPPPLSLTPGRRRVKQRSPSRTRTSKKKGECRRVSVKINMRRSSLTNILCPLQKGIRRASMISTNLSKIEGRENKRKSANSADFSCSCENDKDALKPCNVFPEDYASSTSDNSLHDNEKYTIIENEEHRQQDCDSVGSDLKFSARKRRCFEEDDLYKMKIERDCPMELFQKQAGSLKFSPFHRSEDELQLLVVKMLMYTYPFLGNKSKHTFVVVNNFVGNVRNLYDSNPYHCFRHACDVTQAMYALLQKDSVADNLTPLDSLTLLLTCLIHDIGHTGLSNNVLRRSKDDMVKRFGNESTLEKYHICLATEVLQDNPLLLYLATNERTELLRNMETLILFTDMENHDSFVEELKLVREAETLKNSKTNSRFRILFLGILLKICDISNVARPKVDAEIWSLRCSEEMAALYKISQGLGLEPSLPQPVPSKSQRLHGTVLFALKFVQPLYELLESICPSAAEEFSTGLQLNIKCWKIDS